MSTPTVATDRYRQALEEIAAVAREADETGLPMTRFMSVSEAVGIAVDALTSGQEQDPDGQ